MKRNIAVFASVASLVLGWGTIPGHHPLTRSQSGSRRTARAHIALASELGRLPLAFEPNVGQTNPEAKFLSRSNHHTLFLTSNGAIFSFPVSRQDVMASIPGRPPSGAQGRARADVLRMSLLGADSGAEVIGLHQLPGHVNYFVGKDPSGWNAGLPQYGEVMYRSVYPGVDLSYNGSAEGRLEYDFTLAPGVDPSSIKLGFEGQTAMVIDTRGDLTIRLADGVVRQPRPLIYQVIAGTRRPVSGGYVSLGPNRVGFALGAFDRSRPLVIDPEVVYSTYLGGSDFDLPTHSALDRFGNFYLAGFTASIDFPTTAGAYQPTAPGNGDAFVTKLNSNGTELIYSTYLGGGDFEFPHGLDVDRSGNAYVTGDTASVDFPTTPGALQTSNAGGVDAFVTKLNLSGSALVYSTYLGGMGDDSGGSSPVDRDGHVYVAGDTGSSDFPVTKDAFQKIFAGGDGENCGVPCDGFVAKLNHAGSRLVYSTYLGGSGDEVCCSGAVDRFGHAHISGLTGSTDFPTTPGAFQTSYGGGDIDTFVVEVNGRGSGLAYSTYLGGSDTDFPNDLTLDHQGNTYVAGATDSGDFPTTSGVFQQSSAGGFDGYLTKVNPSGSDLVYSTYLGGTGAEFAEGVAVDKAGTAYVSGVTTSTDFPITNDAIQPSFAGGDGSLCGVPCDAYLLKLSHDASALLFSTYLGGTGDDWGAGGLEVDRSGNAYVPGFTSSADFPTTEGAFQTTFAGVADAFATKIEFGHENLVRRTVRRGPTTPAGGGVLLRWPAEVSLARFRPPMLALTRW